MPAIKRHESKWTSIYWDCHQTDPNKQSLYPYVRLTPHFMGLENAGHPHGLSLYHQFDTEDQAIEYAKMVDDFMDALIADYLEDLEEKKKSS